MKLIFPMALLVILSLQDQKRGRRDPDVKNESYGPHERNVLDLWKAKSDKPTPVVVFIHGGGFLGGSKEGVNVQMIKRCLEKGISVAAINYRYSSQAAFPAPFHDCARAIQYMRSKAKDWNLDPDLFAATGGSAGAGMSLWLAFHDDLADPKNDDPVLRQSSRLKCALVFAAQCSYDPHWIKEHVGGRAHEHPALYKLYGIKPDEVDDEKAVKMMQEASPINHLKKDSAPVYLVYDGRDKPGDKPGQGIHSEKFGQELKAAMDKLGIACELKVGNDTLDSQMSFFAKYLKKE